MLVIYSLWFSELNWGLQPLMDSLWQNKCRGVINFLFLKIAKEFYGDMSVTLGEKIPPTRQLKVGLLDSRYDISALKIKTVQKGHLWSLLQKMWCCSQNGLSRSENFNQNDSTDSGDISGTCRVHHPWCFGLEKDLCRMSAKMFECRSEAWSCCGFASNSWAL
jgi:hypothetical protein